MSTSLSDSGVTFADGSVQASAQFTGLRNRIINGDMRVAQRGTSGVASGYALDRWTLSSTGTQPNWLQTSSSFGGYQVANTLQITGIAGNTGAYIAQKIESQNCRDMAGQTITLSLWVFQNTGSSVTFTNTFSYANSADNFSGITTIGTPTGTSVPSGIWTKVTATQAIPAAATTGLYIDIGSQHTALGAGTYMQIGNVQLELGSTATTFEQRPYGLEQSLCKRYGRKLTGDPLGFSISATDLYNGSVALGDGMRSAPTLDAGASFTVGAGSAGTPAVINNTPNTARFYNSANNWSFPNIVTVTGFLNSEL